ncbi:helix-turn-helix domain-containing protein [Ornithinicoccus hortensis]|uniref:GAF domain-containing protein n=1 Tax=Ornithinicoccus hortensis TaxID=82346 RepID=A0A542YUT3_9MICO|nr:GAF domain-containing protein [Ornithinicoccus hortensis]TQL51848.1 GAF domain-containing protein [Ornithinicoccus hortensis]
MGSGPYGGTLEEARQLRLLLTAAERLFRVQAFDELLEAVLSTARTLLNCDLAHVNLQGTEAVGDQSVRALDGALTEAFRQQRTPAGSGLTGRVADSRSPYITQDYLADEFIRHDPLGDDSVRAEGLVSMVGVPLFRNEDVIGVLMAGYRRRTELDMSHVSTLSTLGSLAALALNSARLHEENQRAVAELRQANASLRAGKADLESSAVAHDRLTTLVLRGAGPDEIVGAVADILGARCVALDPDGAPSGGEPTTLDATFRIGAEEWAQICRSGRAQQSAGADGSARWIVPVSAGSEVLGGIALSRPEAPTLMPLEVRTLERAGVVFALVATRARAVDDARSRMTSDLVRALVSAEGADPLSRERAAQVGLVDGTDLIVLAVSTVDAGQESLREVRGFATSRGGFASHAGAETVVIIRGTDEEQAAADLDERLGASLDRFTIGASRPVTGLADLPQAFQEASACLRAREALGGRQRWATIGALGYLGLLLGKGEGNSPAEFIARSIGPVLEYDARRGSRLRETVECYLESGRSLREAATRLTVHPNTVTQRLGRVADLLGQDWQEPERLVDLQVALRLRRLQEG